MSWTHFYDMYSGGGAKEEPYEHIYIEAPEKEAKVIFYNRFGHNPERVSCTCCGEDYSISEEDTLEQASGYERNCRKLETPTDENGLYRNNNPIIKGHYYLEEGELPPEGYQISTGFGGFRTWKNYQTIEDYSKNKNVLIIKASEIKPEERIGDIPEQGYVWKE